MHLKMKIRICSHPHFWLKEYLLHYGKDFLNFLISQPIHLLILGASQSNQHWSSKADTQSSTCCLWLSETADILTGKPIQDRYSEQNALWEREQEHISRPML